MKQILVPFTLAELGGSQLSFFRLAEILKDDYQFKMWFFSEEPFIEKIKTLDIPYEVFPGSSLRTPWGLMKIKSALKKSAPDYIFLHSSRLIARAAKKLGIPCIEKINMTRNDESEGWCKYPKIDKYFSDFNTKLVVVSEAIKKQMVDRGIAENKIDYLHTFIHPGRFDRNQNRSKTRQHLGIPDTSVLVTNIGRMKEQKAQKDFIQVAAKCLANNERMHFLIVGEGPLEEALRQQAKETGFEDRIHFEGFRDDIENIYSASDIYCHTAHWEPLANVLIEARATGLAVVATDVDGSAEALEAYPYHDIVGMGDIDALAEKVSAWAHNVPTLKAPPLPEKFTPRGAREKFKEIFS